MFSLAYFREFRISVTMKFKSEEMVAVETANQPVTDSLNCQEASFDRYYCPTCTTVMIPLLDNSVQCELLTDKNGLLAIASEINSGSRRGSVQSMTEVQEEVPYKDEVATLEAVTSPNEILLVTRSFENQASPVPPRRSSIAMLFDGIKSLGNRKKSEPNRKFDMKEGMIEEETLHDGIEQGSMESGNDSSRHRISFSDEIETSGKELRRKSFQLDNGTLVEEETAQFDSNLAITTEDASPPGTVNFISRSFETVQENPQPRRESIIEKLNFFKMIPKIGKTSSQESKEEQPEFRTEPVVASGVRRKSLAPSMFLNSLVEDEENEDPNENLQTSEPDEEVAQAANCSASDPDLFCPNPSRYVTTGIRRGSVAAVSAAPPFLDLANRKTDLSQLSPSETDNCPNVRYVEDGIRRGSVAGVSAAPPCICPNLEADDQIMSNTDLRAEDAGVLRSGIRRRSLTPANDEPETGSPESSPKAAKRVAFGLSSSTSDEEDAADEADEFMDRVKERYEKKEGKPEDKKGAVGLIESLTGRKYGVDYASIDARLIQEKFDEEYDEKQKEASKRSIPAITFSLDTSEYEENMESQDYTMNSEETMQDKNGNDNKEISVDNPDQLAESNEEPLQNNVSEELENTSNN